MGRTEPRSAGIVENVVKAGDDPALKEPDKFADKPSDLGAAVADDRVQSSGDQHVGEGRALLPGSGRQEDERSTCCSNGFRSGAASAGGFALAVDAVSMHIHSAGERRCRLQNRVAKAEPPFA